MILQRKHREVQITNGETSNLKDERSTLSRTANSGERACIWSFYTHLLLNFDVSLLKNDIRPPGPTAEVSWVWVEGPLNWLLGCRRSRIWPPWNVLRLAVPRGNRVLPVFGDRGTAGGTLLPAEDGAVLKVHRLLTSGTPQSACVVHYKIQHNTLCYNSDCSNTEESTVMHMHKSACTSKHLLFVELPYTLFHKEVMLFIHQ